MTAHALHIATYNMHKGLSPLNTRLRLPDIARSLKTLAADVVFLQEVQGRHSARAQRFADWPAEAQHHYLARQLHARATYGLNCAHEHGHHGNAILSRLPVEHWCNRDISVNRFESRGVLHCDFRPPGWHSGLTALCVHLNLLARDRKKQFAALRDYIAHAVPAEHALIIAGDFNDWRAQANDLLAGELGLSEVFHTLHGAHARSYPARLPMLTLDRIYTRGLRVTQAQVHHGAPWAQLSDHLPLSATLLPE